MDSTERHTVVTRENVAHPNINRVLHHKCAVIEVIREQMRNIRDWRVERRDVLQRSLGMPLTMKQLALALSALALVLWLALMYGAFLGASLCGNSKSVQRGCTTCGFSFGLIPGIISTRSGHPVY